MVEILVLQTWVRVLAPGRNEQRFHHLMYETVTSEASLSNDTAKSFVKSIEATSNLIKAISPRYDDGLHLFVNGQSESIQ